MGDEGCFPSILVPVPMPMPMPMFVLMLVLVPVLVIVIVSGLLREAIFILSGRSVASCFTKRHVLW